MFAIANKNPNQLPLKNKDHTFNSKGGHGSRKQTGQVDQLIVRVSQAHASCLPPPNSSHYFCKVIKGIDSGSEETQERQFRSHCPNCKESSGPIAFEPGDVYHFLTWIGVIVSLGPGGCHFKMAPCPFCIGQFKHVIQLLLQSGAIKEEVVKLASWTAGARWPQGKSG